MVVDKNKALINKFLERNYPVTRIKINNKFKRGIILDNSIYLLSEKQHRNSSVVELTETLSLIFALNYEILYPIVDVFLP